MQKYADLIRWSLICVNTHINIHFCNQLNFVKKKKKKFFFLADVREKLNHSEYDVYTQYVLYLFNHSSGHAFMLHYWSFGHFRVLAPRQLWQISEWESNTFINGSLDADYSPRAVHCTQPFKKWADQEVKSSLPLPTHIIRSDRRFPGRPALVQPFRRLEQMSIHTLNHFSQQW